MNFRENLVRSLVNEGHKVIIVLNDAEHENRIKSLGVLIEHISLDKHSRSVVSNVRSFIRFCIIVKRHHPDFIFSFTIKPNLFGALAGKFFGVKTIPNVTGLGRLSTLSAPSRFLVTQFYKIALRLSFYRFFQNIPDKVKLLGSEIKKDDQSTVLPGSGVDVRKFSRKQYAEETARSDCRDFDRPVFLFCGRLISAKGIDQFCKAAELIRQTTNNSKMDFWVAGPLDESDPDSINVREFENHIQKNNIRYFGTLADVRQILYRATCLVLPSDYGEGIPKSLLEAAAMGLALITTPQIAQTGILVNGWNGHVCATSKATDQAKAMLKYATQDREEKKTMAKNSAELARKAFSDEKVIGAYKSLLS